MSSSGGQKSNGVVVAADSGGTFTDLLLLLDGELRALKVPSTPSDPSDAVLRGIRELLERDFAEGIPAPELLIHGTTVATNAVLERKGARVGLVTNRGFEDVVEIGRQDRPQLYALVGHRAPPLVSRRDRHGVRGRIGPDGEELEPLDPDELARLAKALAEVDAVAVSLLHSYAASDHEERIARTLAETLGGAGASPPPISVSSRILPEFREYERTSTTVVNAFVAPVVARYLRRLRQEAAAGEIRVMGSAGGALPLSRAIDEPVRTVLSGPAGGVAGALEHGRRVGRTRLLTFDMGGTSTDVSLIPGRLLTTREGRIGDHPVAIPLMDIHTVGAGGGSIARVDPGGALRVGPKSAGADPGPICYGRGGTRVTVTDANLWLGRLRPEGFLGGSARLDRDAVQGPMEALAEELGTDPEAAAEGVIEVADATMERALRVISVERGVDPDDFHLFSFGGAGGLHAAELASRLGARGVLIPPDPGLASAWGMLAAPIVRDRARTLLLASDDPDAPDAIRSALQELSGAARDELAGEGIPKDQLDVGQRIDARYRGQSWELEVAAEDWIEEFHRAHEERYGYRRDDAVVEAVTARVRAAAPGLAPPSRPSPAPDAPEPGRSRVRWKGRTLDAATYWRNALPDRGLEGPAIVLEYSSTLWVPPGWTVRGLEGALLELSLS